MKRCDAIKTAIGSVLGFLVAPFVAKAAVLPKPTRLLWADDCQPGDVMFWDAAAQHGIPPRGWAVADGFNNQKPRGSGRDLWNLGVARKRVLPNHKALVVIEKLKDM